MNIVLLGLPGAGKGTQAKIIVNHLSIPHISTGDLFRQAYQAKTELGLRAKEFMDKGELIPDEVTIGLAFSRIGEVDCARGFLLDGFPRNLNQARALRNYLDSGSKQIRHVVYVEVDENLLLERLTGRRVCVGCGTTFHLIYNPPANDNACDCCNGEIIQREDDREETVKERLKINKELTHKLVQFYGDEGILRKVDGAKGIDEVTKDVLGLF
ncbi:adenylate kinase [Paenibacillus mesophilus]|uniref:adenylate kinase n=1 Tax=Paenibacillus mesophilus TaxID=2582849 RepID=UPI00110DCB84|nr:adenylate kinase [Paenibacillus mesophilus]TMV50316.1 adenylate kinase [Paenibacillus mesophilus]